MNESDDAQAEATVPTSRMLAWVKNSAAYRLSRKMMTEHELSTAIARKARQKFEAISEAQIKALSLAAVEFGRQMRALDDQSYAEVRVRSSTAAGKSRRIIARKLAEKGVDRQIIADALEDTDDFRAALVFARKRAFGPFRRVELDEKRKAKEFSAFARNGFSFEFGTRIMKMSFEEAGELLAELPLG